MFGMNKLDMLLREILLRERAVQKELSDSHLRLKSVTVGLL